MVFRLSEDAQGFKDTLRRFFEKELGSVVTRQVVDPSGDAARRIINRFSALGLNEIYAAQDQALDSLPELVLLASEIGRALCPEHLAEAIVAGPLFFSSFCDRQNLATLEKALGADRLSPLLLGKAMVLRTPLFYQDTHALRVTLENNVYQLSGTLRLVPHSAELAYILYIEQSAAYLIKVDQPGKVVLSAETALDLTQPRVKMFAQEATGIRIDIASLALYQALSRVLVAAEILGACQKVFEMTVDYVKTRQQFSQPVGAFQSVQHALADSYQKIEMLDSLLSFTVWSLKNPSLQLDLSSQALLRFALREGVGILEKAIQLHGGIGFTWEHELHFYLRRVRSLVALAGCQGVHEESFLEVVRQVAAG